MFIQALRLLLTIVLTVTTAACGPTYANVKTTAKLGAGLAQVPIIPSIWTAECQASLIADPSKSFETLCKSTAYQAMVDGVRQASLLLQKYASSLMEATAAEDVTTADGVSAVMDQFGALKVDVIKSALPGLYNVAAVIAADSKLAGKLTVSGVNKIVDTLVRLATSGYRRKALASAIMEAAPHVDSLLRVIEAEARLHMAMLQGLRASMDIDLVARPRINDPDAQTRTLARSSARTLALTKATLDLRIDSLKRLIAACLAFREAHEQLTTQIRESKPWENGEILKALKASLEVIIHNTLS